MISLNRIHIIALFSYTLVLCIFASCVYDRISDDDLNNLPEGETYYLGIKLNFDTDSPPFSRADLEEAVAPVKEDTLETGTDEEHKVALTAKNFVILFKKDDAGNKDKLLGIYDFWDTEQNTDIDENEKEKYPPNAEAKYTYVARIPVKDLDWEGACLVVLNGKPKIYDNLKAEFEGKVDNATLDDVLKAVWAEKNIDEDPRDIGYADKNHKFFTMTNSVYYDDKNKLHIAEEFNAKEHVRKTYAEAKRDPITVYAERMVAKFDFKLKDGNIFYPGKDKDDPSKVSPSIIVFDGFDENNGAPKHKARDWRIEVTGWNVNALETQSYIFKKLPEYKKLNDYLKDFSWWNDAGNYRSYWCEDPHYDFKYYNGQKTDERWRYSWQYRQSYDYVLDDYFDTEEKKDLLLRNYSFDDLNLGKPDMSKFGDEDEYMKFMKDAFNNKVVYTPENTYDANEVLKDFQKEYPGLDMRDELLAGTHILVGAEFQIDAKGFDDKYFVDDGAKFDTGYKTPKHLYRDRVGYYYLSERECLASLVHDFNQLLESQDKMVFVDYDWSSDKNNSTPVKFVADTHVKPGETTADGTPLKYSLYYKETEDGDWYTLTEDKILDEKIFGDDDLSMPVANLRRGDGKRLPWIEKLMDEDRLAIGTNAKVPFLHIYNYEPVEGGDEEPTVADENHIKSLLYEWLGAIEHFKQGRMYYAIGVVNNPPIKEGKTKHYGVVRNNWYRFTLEDVKGIGIPVDKDDQPIVPERDGLNDQVNHSVQILNWHVEESNVDILP